MFPLMFRWSAVCILRNLFNKNIKSGYGRTFREGAFKIERESSRLGFFSQDQNACLLGNFNRFLQLAPECEAAGFVMRVVRSLAFWWKHFGDLQVKNAEAAHKFRMGSTLKTAQVAQSSPTNVLKSLQERDQVLPCAIFTQSPMISGTDHEQDIELDLDYLEYERHVRAQMEFSAKGYKSVNCKLQQPAWRRSLCMFWQRSKLRSNGMRVFGIDQSCITTTPPPPDHVVDSLRIVVDKLQRPAGNSNFPGKIRVPSNSSPLYNTTDFSARPTKNHPSSRRCPAFSEQIFGGKPSDRNVINGSPYVPLRRMQQQQQMASSPLYIV